MRLRCSISQRNNSNLIRKEFTLRDTPWEGMAHGTWAQPFQANGRQLLRVRDILLLRDMDPLMERYPIRGSQKSKSYCCVRAMQAMLLNWLKTIKTLAYTS